MKILVAVPVKPSLPERLQQRLQDVLTSLVKSHPANLGLDLCVFDEPVEVPAGERSIFARPAVARNSLITRYLRNDHDYVFWLDADVVYCPPGIIRQLLAANPRGVSAPLVLVEPVGLPSDGRFYDLTAFVESGRPVYAGHGRYGNVSKDAPYFHSQESLVDCDSVGCCYLIPAHVHRSGVQFAPTPFTDHFPVIHAARQAGCRTVCVRDCVAYHAALPVYGELWHKEPVSRWRNFPFSEYGVQLVSPERTTRRR